MRIQYKGGVWKNSEDEILKAAVMKYGKNQWARIASLLVRKSAKQCKARWFEWLDPSIKKTQWTREEEEKLLHLAKIMPTSWRTIAPMIGRTAAQCLEHYEKLMDQAQQGADAQGGAEGAGPSSAGGAPSSRPRPGEMDPAPESKPARPDPVDMDEDELEMLSEARARLANTKGKKAKRKAREKQLEAAKRLAQLQKRRELKAAGVDLKPRRNNRKVTDYATEVPFEKLPVPGFYDTTKEDDIVAAQGLDKKKQLGKLLQKYKGKTEEEKEEEARKKDEEKRKQLEKVNLPAALGYTQTAPTPASPPLKKGRLSLPAPQLSDLQLEKVAKAGLTSGGRMLQPHHANAPGGADPPAPTGENEGPASEARSSTEPWVATRQRHLETILNLQSTDTPLRGGENTPMVGLGLENGVTPLRSNLTTPNPLASPMSTTNDRDATRALAQAKRDAKRKREKLSEQVMQGLQALPEPENEYAIEADEAALFGLADAPTDVERDTMEEDAEDEERRNGPQYAKDVEVEQRKLLSSAAQKRLPIPSMCSEKMDNSEHVSALVKRDIEAHTILRALSKSEQTHATALQTLRALEDADEVEGKYVQTAKNLIEQQLSEQGSAGEQFKHLIFEQLKASD